MLARGGSRLTREDSARPTPCSPSRVAASGVLRTFAATEDDYENDRGCKDMLKVVKYKELFDNLGDDDRSTLHKYARQKSESLRVSLKRARREAE